MSYVNDIIRDQKVKVEGGEGGNSRVSKAEIRSRTLRMARNGGGGDWKFSLRTWNPDE